VRYKITAVQDTAIGLLWFALRMSLSKNKGWPELATKFNISADKNIVALSFEDEDVSVADVCFSVGKKAKILSSSCYFSDVSLDFPEDWLKDLWNAICQTGNDVNVLEARLLPVSKTKGAFELKIEDFGKVYLEYRIAGMGKLRILNIHAIDKPGS
jgi:hypothetical protein